MCRDIRNSVENKKRKIYNNVYDWGARNNTDIKKRQMLMVTKYMDLKKQTVESEALELKNLYDTIHRRRSRPVAYFVRTT